MALRTLVPRKLRRKWRATKSRIRSGNSPASAITGLESSLSPADTLRSLKNHQWSIYDAQYLLLIILAVFCLSIMAFPSPLFRTFVSALVILSLLIPMTRQFFLPFLPIAGWLVLFYSCKFIPSSIRPEPWVSVLPALENIFYGANLSNILSAHKHWVLDVLAWFPYGITHFGAPAVVTLILFIAGPPGLAPMFAKTFGYMNIAGVAIQLIFPCSPPWYENMYGLVPANYSVHGSPAGLAAIDKLFGVDLYTSTFTASPQVFGAFPSLHSANATLEALFMAHCFPRFAALWFSYTLWIWWATMYLSHHYAIDLVAGSLLAGVCFFVAKAKWIPRMQADKSLRWDYDFVEIGEADNGFTELNDGYYHPARSDDEWTVGESSSIASDGPRERSPSVVSDNDILFGHAKP
ncbi:aureobasidin resistance protein-like protein Aur1 [Microthyrium microscopicum]|uniref:Aureobasidin resistance protein-like protein Aur1 n=1 Tax=Microthyrium microscopicum TaxID=703497 RepID=A0A6A6TXZ3_9PEZI|nr:aureobasidin resistance protein-like protein Aur1 [Microthyrium microscopicum]